MHQHLADLRAMAEHMQYAQLLESGKQYWQHTNDHHVLPLLVVASTHLDNEAAAKTYFQESTRYTEQFDIASSLDFASALISLNKILHAKSVLDNILAQHPHHPLAIARRAHCAMLECEWNAAQQLFEQSLSLQPTRLQTYLALSHIYVQHDRNDKAQKIIEQGQHELACISHQMPPSSHYEFGRLFAKQQLFLWVEDHQYARIEDWLETINKSHNEHDFVAYLKEYTRHLFDHNEHQQAQEILNHYIKVHTTNPTLYLTLSELTRMQGYFIQASVLIQKGLQSNDKNIDLWIELSTINLNLSASDARVAATTACELAEQLDDNNEKQVFLAKAKSALAYAETEAGNNEEAESLFTQTLNHWPGYVPALQGLGHIKMQAGKIQQAIGFFEQIKDINPLLGDTALISARQYPDDDATLEDMATTATRASLDTNVRCKILFQLASAWEQRKDFDKAFYFAQLANQASRKLITYDKQQHRQDCARIRHGFCAALFDHRKDCGHPSTLPVYVVGMPRSGTTLVEQILAAHSDIVGGGELGVIPQVAYGLNRWERHVGSGRSYPDCVDDLTPYITHGLAEGVLSELRDLAPHAKHIVDKLPHNFEFIGLIKFLFPNAKIISVRRDPRDIALSNYFIDYKAKHNGMGFAYDMEEIGRQLADHNQLMHHWQQIFPGEILEVNYEDIVDDIEASARKMLNYIGVSWQPQVLAFNKSKQNITTASMWQVRQPLYKSSKGKWQRYQQYLAPLIKGTNAKIETEDIDMFSLPEPGLLASGVDAYNQNDLDKAELKFKTMLHYNPKHAACTFMLGSVYLRKGYYDDGIQLMEDALIIAPWQEPWHQQLDAARKLSQQPTSINESATQPNDEIVFDFSDTLLEIHDHNELAD